MQVKICGITDQANMVDVARLRPEYMGFIFYPSSRRDVSSKIDRMDFGEIPAAIDKVAVMVNEPLEKARSLVMRYGFQAAQLHGNESPDYCNELGDLCMIIKTFSISDRLPATLADYEGSCDLFLFDTASDLPGGSGKKFDHAVLKGYRAGTPFFLSGGISPGDAVVLNKLAAELDLFVGVDLNSRFESSVGLKDIGLLSQFMKSLNL